MKEKIVDIKYFECNCGSADHTLRFVFDYEEKEVYTEVQLKSPKFHERVWKAVKYIFGFKSKYGHWDCTLMLESEVKVLRDELTNFLEKIKK
jgi:hypothetical protein